MKAPYPMTSKKKSNRSKLPSPHHFNDPEEGLSRQTSHPRFVALANEDFYCVAAALGQLKVAGVMNDRARVTHPDWPYADLNQQRLQAMRQVLDAVQRGA